MLTTLRKYGLLMAAMSILPGCGGSSSGSQVSPQTYTVGSTVSGLAGTGLVLELNGGNDLPVSASGSATFSSALAVGAAYSVTVKTQPSSPSQACTIANGTGTLGNSNVTNITVACTTTTHSVGGTITGFTGSGLVLEDNAGDDLAVSPGASTFTFATAVASGSAYAVTVKSQPTAPAQTCTVTGGTGTVGGAAVTSAALTCIVKAGRFVYVANNGDTTISAFAIDPTTGALTAISGSPFRAGTYPFGIKVNSSATFLYVANSGSNSISVYSIDQTTGALTAIAGSPFAADPSPEHLVFDRTGSFLYVTSAGGIDGFKVDSATGALTPLTGSPFSVGASRFPREIGVLSSAAAQFLYVNDIDGAGVISMSAFPINSGTGVLAEVSGSPFSVPYHSPALQPLATDASGPFVFAGNDAGITAYAVTASTGVPTLISTATGVLAPAAMLVDPAGKFLYVVDENSSGGSGYVRVFNVGSGGALTATSGSPYATGDGFPASIAIDPSGKFAYVGNDSSANLSAYTVDPATGALTPVAGAPFATGANPDAIAID
jgi:6-phosphogluconolactonase (cycloisomerase 2 family)